MTTDWYAVMLANIERAHMSLLSAKTHAEVGSDWERQLKYQLRAFRAGAVIVNDTAPEPMETRMDYLWRLQPALDAIPDSVAAVDLDPWRSGMRELSRACNG